MKRAKLQITVPVPKPRNPGAAAPLLKKGGAHGKTTAALRRQRKVELRVELRRLERDPGSAE